MTCCATSRSAGMPTRRRRCATSPTPRACSTSSTSRPGTTRRAVACVDTLADGVIGEPEHVAYTMLLSIWRAPLRAYGWQFDAESGGGWLRSIGSHQIDFTRWTFGEVAEVGCQLRFVTTDRPDADGKLRHCTGDDGFVLVLRTDRGVTVVMDSTASAPVSLPLSTLVVGSRGILEEVGYRVVARTPEGERELTRPADDTDPLLADQLRYFEVVRDAVHERHLPPDVPTFDDGLACSVVLDRALDAARG